MMGSVYLYIYWLVALVFNTTFKCPCYIIGSILLVTETEENHRLVAIH